jgi:TonB family protein
MGMVRVLGRGKPGLSGKHGMPSNRCGQARTSEGVTTQIPIFAVRYGSHLLKNLLKIIMKKQFLAALLLLSAVCYAAPPVPPAPPAPPEVEIIEPASLSGPIQIVYPPKAQRGEEEGTVVLKMQVLADGSTAKVVIFKSSGYPLLDSAAVESATGAKFVPAKSRLGMPIESTVLLPVIFKLLPEI